MLLVCITLSLVLASAATSNAFVLKSTTEGPVLGLDGNVQEFLGIPFAQPPIGGLRFAPPQPAVPRAGGYNATYVRSACLQASAPFPGIPTSEDCLYLNIYRPQNASNAAVMIWIHGGSFTTGTGGDYDGSYLANNSNSIIVTINYRLGAFGWLALAELLLRYRTTGNYGLQDQRLAISWVRRNIAYFGGNSSKITIAGESAGAFSVCTHLAAPRSQGLYRAAIMESTYQQCEALGLLSAISQGQTIVTAANCELALDRVYCLQHANASDILQASDLGTTWKPVLDGYELSQQPYDYIQSGDYAQVPVLLGTNADEFALFVCDKSPLVTMNSTQQLKGYLGSLFGSDVENAISLVYNLSNYNVADQAAIEIFTDYLFKCPTKELAGLISGTVNVWMYSFNYVARGKCGAAHATEIPFLFPSRYDILNRNGYVFDAQEQVLSHEMCSYWINFVENLNPSYLGQAIAWPVYNEPNELYLNLDLNLSIGQHFEEGYCQVYDNVPQIALVA